MHSSLERVMSNGLFLGMREQSPRCRVYQNPVVQSYLIRHRIYEKEYLAIQIRQALLLGLAYNLYRLRHPNLHEDVNRANPLSATLTGWSISVACKGLNGSVGAFHVPYSVRRRTRRILRLPDRCGAGGLSAPGLIWTFDGQSTVADQDTGRKAKSGKDRRARRGFGVHGRE